MAEPATPVAVIGMGCRLPGGINSPEQLWDALLAGDDLVTEIPLERWDADDYYDPEPGVPGRSVSRWGAFLDDVAGFDSEFFGMGDREATAIDPQHRLLLETSWEAVEHAGVNPADLAGSATGVFMGQTQNDYALLAADARALEGPYGFTGTNYSMASGRVSYALGLHGPAITVDTACSSSLMAVHLACRSLHDGDSDLALAGGVSVILEPRKATSASAEGMLSPTGRCHAFDVAADGFVVSEGCAVVFLKRLQDALRDDDRILAVVRGTAVNQDGHTVNIATPSLDAQAAVYRAALASARVDAATVGMVEAHGTGTPVGDPIEYASLAQVYGIDGACALASVKSNFGHGQSASGAMGLMKAVLSLQHGVVPENLHFTRLPDDLARTPTKLFVPQANTPWPTDGDHPRRAAVSSYGLSGTNVHAVLEQAPARTTPHDVAPPSPMTPPLVFPLSSTSAEGLRLTAGRLADWVAAGGSESDTTLMDLAYTLTRRRGHRPVRTAVIAGDPTELVNGLREIAYDDTPYQAAVGQDDRGPVWLFSGQGSQWAAMGVDLLTTEPVFASSVAEMEQLIAAESGFSVTEAMSANQTVTGIDHIQPTLFAMQVALANTMLSYGVRPGAVIGHSLGEVAAAVVAGGLSLHDGVRVICRRSRLMSRIAGSGAMASVELPASQVLSELAARCVTDVVLSVVASPQSAVVGGATQTVRDLVSVWEQRGVMAREVAVDVASHSPQVEPILAELAEVLADLSPTTPTIPFYSATQYDPRGKTVCDAAYWVDNLRHMVRFGAAVGAALEDGYRVFAELTPHPLLTHAVEQTARSFDMPIATLTSMRREQPLPHGMRGFLSDLHSAGAKIDFSVLNPQGRLVDAPLPTWTHRQLLLTRDGQDTQTHGAQTVSVHPLLGAHVRLHEEPERHAWQADVGTTALPWLGDHRIHNVSAFPGAAYCEMALAAARAVIGEECEVRDIRFEQMLLIDNETQLGAVASVDAPGVATFAVETDDDGERVRRASAVLHAAEGDDRPSARDIGALLADHPDRVEGAEMRQWFDACGIQFGPAFTGLAVAHTASDTVLAEIGLPGAIRSQQSTYGVHPALLDACFQSVAAHPAVHSASGGGLLLPMAVARLRCHGQVRNAHYCYTRLAAAGDGDIEADIDVLDEHGTVLLTMRGLRMGTGVSENRRNERVLGERLLTIEWRHREVPAAAPGDAGTWLLISTSDGADLLANTLADALKLAGAQCTTMSWTTDADHRANAERLGELLSAEATTGLVVVTAAENGNNEAQCALRGRQCVSHLVRIARELPDAQGATPRLYVITRDAQTVLPGDVANLEQGGLRGLIRVIGTEHPHLRATQIDVDTETDAARIAEQLLLLVRRRRNRVARRPVVCGAAEPESASPAGAAHHSSGTGPRWYAHADPDAR